MSDEILFERRGQIGLVTLNRPQALNALTRSMCCHFYNQLGMWAQDESVRAVVVKGAGDKAFCAGGDVVGLYHAGKEGSPDFERFFFDEYRLNFATGTYSKPYIALIDGIVMGGGVGLSIHGPYRVATEKTLFAMPETAIGLIPDVGGTHALGHMAGELGTFLGLTGERLKAADCLYAGIATHYVSSSDIESLIVALAQPGADVASVLASVHQDPGASPLALHEVAINRYFSYETVGEILADLSMGDEWALKLRDKLFGFSPTSMKLTLQAIRAAKGLTLAQALTQEYRIVCQIKHGHDFYEGVRAQLMDKDKKPRWKPAALSDVTTEMVDAHFQVPAGGDLSL